jgi:NAD(P)-dependent dehydrogenase (short-subunit alcohol dehydrogenase family)
MSFDYLKSAFLDRWGGEDRPSRRNGPPARSYSVPPHSVADSGSETESTAPSTLVPHSHSAVHLPPAAPTPPNEPVSEIQEMKTQISINAEHGSGQITLSISDNKQRKRKKNTPEAIGTEPPDSRSASPSRLGGHHPHRQIEASPASPRVVGGGHIRGGDRSHVPPNAVQVIEANPDDRIPHPDVLADRMTQMDLYKPDEVRPPTPPVEPSSPPASTSTPPPPPLRPRLLEGKVAAITGASRGIGRAIALGFAREGAHIIAHYWGTKSDPANEEIVSLCVDVRSLGQGCTIVFGDISDPRTSETIVRRAVETHGRLDIAVGNAGMCWYRDFLDVTPELLQRHVDVNLHGNFYFVQAAARQFKRQFHDLPVDTPKSELPDYSVICVSASASASDAGKMAHYSPTAAGVRELMRSCARGLAGYGVRCNTVAPGIVQTKMVKEVVEDMEIRGRMEKRNPFGRLGVPGDVVGPTVWLASEGARWTTGQEIVVDGGSSVG